MSELVKIESIVISLISECPDCNSYNATSRDHFPNTETVVNDETQLFYFVTCSKCKTKYKIGTTVTNER